MLKIPEFRMWIDAPGDCGLASAGGIHLFGPTHGGFGLGVTRAGPGDDPAGDLESRYETMAAFGPIGTRGATFLNRRDPAMPFLGAIRDPGSGSLFLLPPYNHVGLTEDRLRGECGRLIQCVGFTTAAMEQWSALLSGASLIAIDTHRRDLASADGYSAEERYTFRADGLFEWTKEFHISIGGGGLSASRSSRSRRSGSWDVVDEEGRPALRLDDSEGSREVLALERRGPTALLDGSLFRIDRRA